MKTPNAMKYAVIAILVLFLSGCGSKVQTLVYGKSIPENQSTVLIIPDAYTVTNFDGECVKWTTSADYFSLFDRPVAEIRIPSGKHNIAYSYYMYHRGTTSTEHYSSGAVVYRTTGSSATAFNGNITINMEAGKRYRFRGREIVLDIYD